jgi:hypothetical protein
MRIDAEATEDDSCLLIAVVRLLIGATCAGCTEDDTGKRSVRTFYMSISFEVVTRPLQGSSLILLVMTKHRVNNSCT